MMNVSLVHKVFSYTKEFVVIVHKVTIKTLKTTLVLSVTLLVDVVLTQLNVLVAQLVLSYITDNV